MTEFFYDTSYLTKSGVLMTDELCDSFIFRGSSLHELGCKC